MAGLDIRSILVTDARRAATNRVEAFDGVSRRRMMLRLVETGRGGDALDAAAVDVLRALFEGVTGTPPRTLRAYRDDDALLLLLRYDPEPFPATDPPVEIALMALAQLVAEAVATRTGHAVVSGGVSLCAPQGLAVLAFSVADGPPCEARLRLAG